VNGVMVQRVSVRSQRCLTRAGHDQTTGSAPRTCRLNERLTAALVVLRLLRLPMCARSRRGMIGGCGGCQRRLKTSPESRFAESTGADQPHDSLPVPAPRLEQIGHARPRPTGERHESAGLAHVAYWLTAFVLLGAAGTGVTWLF
jgi:hypothetical protein